MGYKLPTFVSSISLEDPALKLNNPVSGVHRGLNDYFLLWLLECLQDKVQLLKGNFTSTQRCTFENP